MANIQPTRFTRDANGVKRPERGTDWKVRYKTPEGASRSKTFPTKALAERFAAGVETQKNSGGFADPMLGRITFTDWWERWWPTTVGMRDSTRVCDEVYAANHVLPIFGSTPIGRIDRLAVTQWIADLTAAGYAPATVHRNVQILAKAMRAAAEARLIPSSPVERVPLPKIERHEMRHLTPAEIATLADAIDPRWRALVLLGAYGGLRIGEMLALRRRRLDLMRREVHVAETLYEIRGRHVFNPPKTKAGYRRVPIPKVAAEALELHCHGQAPDDLVFTAAKGGPVRVSLFRRRIWQPATAAAGVEGLRLHDLRHTAVSLWIATGADPKEVATWAGHTSTVIVYDRYGHLMPGRAQRVMDALDAVAANATARTDADVIQLPQGS
jgi:integrase